MLGSEFRHTFIVTKLKGIHRNGATIYFHHLSHTLEREFFCESTLIAKEDFSYTGEDVIWFQSEWYNVLRERLQEARSKGAKTICLLGHFVSGPHEFPEPSAIEADHFVSMWKGPAVDAVDHDVTYFPHAFCTACDIDIRETLFDNADILWTGNTHVMRDEGVFKGIHLTQAQGVDPEQLNKLYREARISLNLHGDCQKGVVLEEYTNKPAYALNERFFHIIGAGGYQVCDKHPLIKDTLKSKVLQFTNESSLMDLLDPMNYQEWFYDKAQEEVLQKHTYVHRLQKLADEIWS